MEQEKMDYVIDENGNKHYIHPMELTDFGIVSAIMSRISLLNAIDKITFNEKDELYNALMELFELILQEPKESIEEWLDTRLSGQIINQYFASETQGKE